MKKNKKIISGDFWSTKSSSSIPGMLVFVDCPDNNTMLGYPMFCESTQATGECFLLAGHPEFNELLDERWVNFASPTRLDDNALFAKLGHSQYALDCLRAFQKGKSISLLNGIPMINGIGDPREEFHAELTKALQKLAGISFVKLTVNALKNTIICEKAISIMDYLKQGQSDIPLLANTVAVRGTEFGVSCGSMMSPLGSCLSAQVDNLGGRLLSNIDSDTRKSNGFVVQIHGKDVLIQLNIHGKISTLTFSGADLAGVDILFEEIEEWQKVAEVNTGIFATKPLNILPCKVQFIFTDGNTEIVALNKAK